MEFVKCEIFAIARHYRGKAKKNSCQVPIFRGWYLPAIRATCFIFAGAVLAGGRW